MPTPWKGSQNSERAGGLKSQKILKDSMKLKWNFQRGWGGSNPNTFHGGVWIFSGKCIEWLITLHHVESPDQNNYDGILDTFN